MDAIVSVTRDWAIGRDGALLVRNKADMHRFVELTRGCTCVMGRKTYESFPGGPLKGRRNVVVSRREGGAGRHGSRRARLAHRRRVAVPRASPLLL